MAWALRLRPRHWALGLRLEVRGTNDGPAQYYLCDPIKLEDVFFKESKTNQ